MFLEISIFLSISSSNEEQQLLSFSAILNCHKIQTTCFFCNQSKFYKNKKKILFERIQHELDLERRIRVGPWREERFRAMGSADIS